MIGYFKQFDGNKTMSFRVINKGLLKSYIKISGRINSLTGKEVDSEPVYGDNYKYIQTKTKTYVDKVNTNFQGKQTPKENASYKCLSLIVLESVTTVNKKYYLQTLLEECKYEIKKTKMENLINDNLDSSSSGESDNEEDDGSDSGSDKDESND